MHAMMIKRTDNNKRASSRDAVREGNNGQTK